MRREIPDDAYIVLEQSQVHTQRIVIIKVAQCTAFGQLPDLADCPGEQKGVIHHDGEFLPGCQFDEFFCLRRARRERFLDKHVFAVLEGPLSQFVVSPYRRNHRDRINFA